MRIILILLGTYAIGILSLTYMNRSMFNLSAEHISIIYLWMWAYASLCTFVNRVSTDRLIVKLYMKSIFNSWAEILYTMIVFAVLTTVVYILN